jgi:hypothetical protein
MFIWQAGIVNYTLREKPDFIVLTGVDPHIVSNLFLSLVCKLFFKTKVIWWGHADLEKKRSFGKIFRLFFFNLSAFIFTYNDEGKKIFRLWPIGKYRLNQLKTVLMMMNMGIIKHSLTLVKSKTQIVLPFFFQGVSQKKKDWIS